MRGSYLRYSVRRRTCIGRLKLHYLQAKAFDAETIRHNSVTKFPLERQSILRVCYDGEENEHKYLLRAMKFLEHTKIVKNQTVQRILSPDTGYPECI